MRRQARWPTVVISTSKQNAPAASTALASSMKRRVVDSFLDSVAAERVPALRVKPICSMTGIPARIVARAVPVVRPAAAALLILYFIDKLGG